MTGERRIAAPPKVVWDALNDPAVLKASIPGCERLEKLSDTEMKAAISITLGPISAKFNGAVQLSDIDPPTGYRISGVGQGRVAGFAKGGANVTLMPDQPDTILSYAVNAQVGGKLAHLGTRLIDATAKQMADAFFDRFSGHVLAMVPAVEPVPVVDPIASQVTNPGELETTKTAPIKYDLDSRSSRAIIVKQRRHVLEVHRAVWVGGCVVAAAVLLIAVLR